MQMQGSEWKEHKAGLKLLKYNCRSKGKKKKTYEKYRKRKDI